jgi:hypothetical protein
MGLGAQLHEGQDRCFRICQDLPVNGNQIPGFRQALKLLKGWIVGQCYIPFISLVVDEIKKAVLSSRPFYSFNTNKMAVEPF